MNFRLMAGFLFIAVLCAIPASALPDIGSLYSSPPARTGSVVITMNEINSTEIPETVAVTYSMGNVYELPASVISEERPDGIVMIRMDDTSSDGNIMYLSDTNSKNSVYKVQALRVAEGGEFLLTNQQSFTVIPATANYYRDEVPEGKQHEWIDLDWKNSEKDLGLTVYAPDKTFGPFADMTDGRKDGRIFLDISSKFNVTPGSWIFKVQNSLEDYTPYSLNTYSA
ncbi:MAG: hypothetical protein M0Q92_08035 [Methanoregula sp.]|nr:hypothetical protein [Methanoregula sp.]